MDAEVHDGQVSFSFFSLFFSICLFSFYTVAQISTYITAHPRCNIEKKKGTNQNYTSSTSEMGHLADGPYCLIGPWN